MLNATTHFNQILEEIAFQSGIRFNVNDADCDQKIPKTKKPIRGSSINIRTEKRHSQTRNNIAGILHQFVEIIYLTTFLEFIVKVQLQVSQFIGDGDVYKTKTTSKMGCNRFIIRMRSIYIIHNNSQATATTFVIRSAYSTRVSEIP